MPGANGIFDVQVDGELVFTKSMLGRYPDPDDVAPLLRAKLGSRARALTSHGSRRLLNGATTSEVIRAAVEAALLR